MSPETPEELLASAAEQQRRYDVEAVRWQRLHFRARMAVLVLGVLTAAVGVARYYHVLEYFHLPLLTDTLIILPVGAALLTLAVFLVNPGQRWVAYRTGSESLKTEAFLFATATEKYAAADSPGARADLFRRRLQELDELVQSLQPQPWYRRFASAFRRWRAGPLSSDRHVPGTPLVPAEPLGPDRYLRERLRPQKEWYQRRSLDHRRTQVVLGIGVFLFNAAAGLLAYFGAYHWVPVFTTMVGALTTYASLSNSEFLANSYQQTVKQLDRLEQAWERGDYVQPPNDFHRFVYRVEQVIAREYTGWMQTQPSDSDS